jgi:hypothetical protein
MIIYVILVGLLVVTTFGAIVTCNDHGKLHTALVVACFVSFYGLFIFAGQDHYYRKNVEAVNVVATIEDKHERRAKTSKNTWATKYSLYISYDGETDQKEVDKKIYDKWEVGQEVQGQKIYYTTGFTNINTYEYVWAF